MSSEIAWRAASFTSAGAAKSGKPCERLTALCFKARRVISRITDSVNCSAFAESMRRAICAMEDSEAVTIISQHFSYIIPRRELGYLQSCLPKFVPLIPVGSQLEQLLHRTHLPSHYCLMQRSISEAARCVNFGPCGYQDLDILDRPHRR